MLSAKSAIVDFHSHKIEALLLCSDEPVTYANAQFFIGVSQVSELFSLDKTVATRDLKSLLGADLSLVKISTNLNSNPVNAITLDQFEKVILRLAIKGNKIAIELAESLIGLSLQQFVCDTFWVKFEKEEREAYAASRKAGKNTRFEWRDLVGQYLANKGTSQQNCVATFANLSNQINRAVTGHEAPHWRKELNLPAKALLRDYWSSETLFMIDKVESVAVGYLKQGKSPLASVTLSLNFLDVKVIDEPLRG